jgi:hypothetical protein
MKGNIKKLAVFVIIAPIAMFMTVATASAQDQVWNSIQGNYAFTGSNTCLVAPFGFDSSFRANPPPGSPPGTSGVWVTDFQSWEGSYRFYYNGTGELNILDHDFGATPGAAGSVSIYWKFNYTVTDNGKITFTLVPNTYKGLWLTGPMKGTPVYLVIPGSWDGAVSPYGNTITVTWGAPLILYLADSTYTPIGVQLICDGSFVLIRQQAE